MRHDELEFLIAQYADGTLAPAQMDDVEAVLRRDARARALLESYRSVDGVLAGMAADEAPLEVRCDRLQERISRQVAGLTPGVASSFPDEVEEQFSRHAEGTLSPAEARLIEARLQADPQARLVLSEYSSLERLFAAVRATPLPPIRWEALADHISRTAMPDDAQAAEPAESYKLFGARRSTARASETGVLGRIGMWLAAPRRLAIAACLLIAGTVSISLMKTGGNQPGLATPVAPAGDPNQQVAKTPSTPGVAPNGPRGGGIDVIVNGGTPSFNPGDNNAASVQIGPPAGGVVEVPSVAGNDPPPSRSALIAPDKAAGQDKKAKASRDSGWLFSH